MTTHTSTSSGMSQCEKIAVHLMARPGVPVAMPELHEVSGSMNIHSRIADLRKRGMNIENKTVWSGKSVQSFYIYTKPAI